MTEPNKIFVGGLSWDTTKESLQQYFEQFGGVQDAVIMVDAASKKPRGFGFVTFEDDASVMKVLHQSEHIIDSKKVDPKRATQKTGGVAVQGYEQQQQQNSGGTRKIFVGGLSNDTTKQDAETFFSSFGEVKDVDLKYDKANGRMRGFGFVEFASEEAVERTVQIHFHQLNGKTVEVKRAQPRATAASMVGYKKADGQEYSEEYSAYQGWPQAQQQQQYNSVPASYSNYYAAAAYAAAMANYNYPTQQQVGAVQNQRVSSYGQGASGYNRSAYGSDVSSYTGHTGYGYDSYGSESGQSAAAAAAGYSQVGQGQQSQRSLY